MATRTTPLTVGVSELLVLGLLAKREMYGYELAKAVQAVTRREIHLGEGLLYPLLHRLELQQLLRSRRMTVSGRPRIYYRTTARGGGTWPGLPNSGVAPERRSIPHSEIERMPDDDFTSLAERLLRCGIAPRDVRRLVTELASHYDSLVEQERARSQPLEFARSVARSRLGRNSKEGLGAAGAQVMGARWPMGICGFAAVVGLIAWR